MAETAKKSRVIVKEFLVDGDWVSRVHEDAEAFRITVIGCEDKALTYNREDFPENIQASFFWSGLSHTSGDSGSAGKGTDPIDRHVMIESRMDSLLDGVWSEKREGHALPRTQLYEALCRLNQARVERDLTADEKKSVATHVAAMSQDDKKAAGANPEVALHVIAIQEEAKKLRVKKLKEAAKTSDSSAYAIV